MTYRFTWTTPDTPGIWQKGMLVDGKVEPGNAYRVNLEEMDGWHVGWWCKLMDLPEIEQPEVNGE